MSNQDIIPGLEERDITPRSVCDGFDPSRLTQARRLAELTKKELAGHLGVTPAAVGQYETGVSRPRPDLIPRLAELLNVPMKYFLIGRPSSRLDSSMAYFRSLRSTPKAQRERSLAFAEQVWELTFALEKRIQMPLVDLPGFAGGEVHPGADLSEEPSTAAQELRERWGLGDGPVTHLVRRMESHGIAVVLPPEADPSASSVDAFSTRSPRPLVVLTRNRADDVYRHRFSAAHELGHLVLHSDATGDNRQEREADAFAAEFLTPRASIQPLLPGRMDLARLADLRRAWGVSIHSLIYRCRELGLISDATSSRAFQRLRALNGQPGFTPEPVSSFPGEQPVLLRQAFELAAQDSGLTTEHLAHELGWKAERVRELLNVHDQRPVLRLVK
ncbi:ImmA/IrrE family metallo-endopeptidase [Streptomyces sp. SID4946]|uniref:helix-turn-helix domain-containing protein n=1 Tax=Streptomyces sp. LamerLS-31b TaxID=1839765 RepID=UPI00081D62DC|nr:MULTISPECIES: XRE family transcriptional regulator [unclassified Streptomyces]MYQ90221.1 ImmA/IrrE family metallo-endopeptidase [Streptomyces sp. SID4946]SCF57873.1 Zn-dependent peptidase ImmA, M78 family [Streptomyces sp. LamerLS-31b]SCF59066.1 Zn-dependent peptidase ImmA, M78 family [Streptomyces sp. DconLS]